MILLKFLEMFLFYIKNRDMKQNLTFEDLEGAYTNERAAAYNRLYPWRLHTYWHKEAIPNIYTFDLPSLRYDIYKC
jgi:hypothetical protein